MNTKKILTTVLLSLLVVILFSIFTGCNVIKSDLLLPQLMVLRKALASIGNADNSVTPVTSSIDAPTFSPTAGTYTTTQSVTISTTTTGAILCYTLDGSTPSCDATPACSNGTLYSSPVSIATTTTLKSLACKAGNLYSAVGTGGYVIGGNIVYTGSPYIFSQNALIVPIVPTVTGIINNCAIAPALPTGLNLSSTTCGITGTASVGNLATTYTITASINSVSVTATIIIKIQGITALRVYGQFGSFTTNLPNNGGVSAQSLNFPYGVSLDSNSNVYISEYNNHRVLFFPAGSTTATRVYGQLGSFTTNIANNGGISADSLFGPVGIKIDSNNNLYVGDRDNQRILFFPSGLTTATRVYGQLGNFTTSIANNGGISANSLNTPTGGVTVDSNDNLFITDSFNMRVLFYPSGSTTATNVYGQAGNFTTNTPNNGGISANSLNNPGGVAVDQNNTVYIAELNSHRVLAIPFGSTTATSVYGQGGNFTTNIPNNGGLSANSLNTPYEIAVDQNGSLFVADAANNRVLVFPIGSNIPSRVYGQGGSFLTNNINNGGLSANSLNKPRAIAIDKNGDVYIADTDNSRVLVF